MSQLKILDVEDVENDEEYDEPNNSSWILCISDRGVCSVMSAPNIHFSFFDNGYEADDIPLLGYEKLPAGVYKVIMSFSTSVDWETGIVDDVFFNYESHETLWLLH